MRRKRPAAAPATSTTSTCRASCTPRSCVPPACMRASCASTQRKPVRLPGVHAVITAADVPNQRPIGVAKDHLPLKTDRVRSIRDEIAGVAAETEAIARAALALIEVEYEDLPIVTDAQASLEPGAPLIHPPIPGAPAKAPVGLAGKTDNIAMRFDYEHGDVVAGRSRVGRDRRGQLLAALRDALLHGRVGRDRRVRRARQPAAVFEHAGAVPAQARVRRDPGHGPGPHAHHPAADRRRLRLQARHLSVRDHLRLSGARHRPRRQAGVQPRGGIRRLADAPAGAPDAAFWLHPRRHGSPSAACTRCTTTARTPPGARPRRS